MTTNLKTTMRTAAEEAALSAFVAAAASDSDPGYPNGAAFIPWQETPWTDRALWRYLHEDRPAVMVGVGDFDMLIEPLPLGRLARLRNEVLRRITVQISCRGKKTPLARGTPPVRADIGRHALVRLTSAAV
jgi:hypothetical protein